MANIKWQNRVPLHKKNKQVKKNIQFVLSKNCNDSFLICIATIQII